MAIPLLLLVRVMRLVGCWWSMLQLLPTIKLAVDGRTPQSHYHKPKLSPDDFLVRGLEDAVPVFAKFPGIMYAGLVSTTPFGEDQADEEDDENEEGELMFWLFCPEAPKYDDTLVIWLNGGPGCSSLGGNLFEQGPVTIPRPPAGYYGTDSNAPLEYNPYAWTNATMMLYVEQPHGTGFSTGPFPTNETEVGRDFFNFLQNLFTVFQASSNRRYDLRFKKLHFFGESYAGMYVPSIAHYIHEQNKVAQHPHIRLSGIGLGNGWIDATVQGPAVIDYAWWHGMIDTSTVKAMKQQWENCKDGSGHQPEPFHTFTVPDECGIMAAVLQAAGTGVVEWGAPNAYDVSTWDKYEMLDAPNGTMALFYNTPAVQDALNVKPRRQWIECMPGAGRRRRRHPRLDEEHLLPGQILLANDKPVSVVPYIAQLLDDAKIQVLIYNGNRDMTTNAQASELLLDSMDWSGADGWADTKQFERGLWLPFTETLGGYIKSFKNLEFLVVSNSGHLVPTNRDEVALELISRFLGNVSFMDKELPKFQIAPKNKESAGSKPTSTVDVAQTVNEAEPSVVQTRRGGHGWAFFCLLVGLAAGYTISDRIAKKRRGYEMVPNGDPAAELVL